MAAAMAWALGRYQLDALAWDGLVRAFGVDHDSVFGNGLELALVGFGVVQNYTDLLARRQSFKSVPGRILGGSG
jgi:hypothetical protein